MDDNVTPIDDDALVMAKLPSPRDTMNWCYQVVRRTVDGETTFGIHEAYRGQDNTLYGWTENPVSIIGNSYEELITELVHALAALGRPVIDDDTQTELT